MNEDTKAAIKKIKEMIDISIEFLSLVSKYIATAVGAIFIKRK